MAAVVLLVLPAAPASAAAGSVDPSFDTDGLVTTDFGSNDRAFDVALQPDGKIVAAGHTLANDDVALARYNANGSLDTSFDSDGKVTTDFGAVDGATAVLVQPDGRIVIAGATGDEDFAVARYNADGTLDTSFSTDGKLTVDFASGSDFGNDAILQADGKIVVVGSTFPPGTTSSLFAVARVNVDGSLDTSFDSDGKVTTDVAPGGDFANAVGLTADGRIVVAGTAVLSGPDFGAVRYTTAGALDPSFDSDGKVITDLAGNDIPNSVVVQPDGKIVIIGETGPGADMDFGLARLNPDGSLDNSFDADGKVIAPIGTASDRGLDGVLQADGDLIVVGDTDGEPSGFSVARFTPSGAFDTTFDTDGKNVTDFSPQSDDDAMGVALQPDGSIVAAGMVRDISAGDFGLVRWSGDPAVSVTDVTVAEGRKGTTAATFQVSLSAAHDVPVTVRYSTSDGTATAPGDYQAVGATDLTFNPGETTKVVTVNVVGDRAAEADEQFALDLTAVSNVAVLDTRAVATITNDDTAPTHGRRGVAVGSPPALHPSTATSSWWAGPLGS